MPEIHCPMHSRYNHATPILLYEGKKKDAIFPLKLPQKSGIISKLSGIKV